MAFTDLREFVARLEQHGRLRRIGVPVSRDLEITEIVDRVSKTGGDGNVALLFERVEGFDMPVLVNAFGTEDRMAAALGVERLDALGERIAKLLDLKLPGSFLAKLKKLGTLLDVAKAVSMTVFICLKNCIGLRPAMYLTTSEYTTNWWKTRAASTTKTYLPRVVTTSKPKIAPVLNTRQKTPIGANSIA